MTKLCTICNKNDPEQCYGEGLCPTCGDIFCESCMKHKKLFDKCPNCKVCLKQTAKKIFKDLIKLEKKITSGKHPDGKRPLFATLICLAERYYLGQGTKMDKEKARQIYQRLSDEGCPVGDYNLYFVQQELEEPDHIKSLERAAEKGFCKAEFLLSMVKSDYGEKHTPETIRLLKKAAIYGYPDAEFRLGLDFFLGNLGEEPCSRKASFWYKRAAEKEHPSALNNLALLNQKGDGCLGELDRALGYYERSCAAGSIEGCYGCATIFEQKEDLDKAACFYFKCMAKGFAPAYYRLGMLKLKKKVHNPSLTDAENTLIGLEMIKKSANMGYQEAIDSLTEAMENAEVFKEDEVKNKDDI